MLNENIKLNFLFVCENAFFAEDKKLSIIGIFEIINAPQLPAIHPKFSIALGISGDIISIEKELQIISPSGKVILKSALNPKIIDPKGKTNLVSTFGSKPLAFRRTFQDGNMGVCSSIVKPPILSLTSSITWSGPPNIANPSW